MKNCFFLAFLIINLAPVFAQSTAQDYLKRGDENLEKGTYERALADYNNAIKTDPNYAEAYAHRGDAYLKKNDYDLAIAECNQAIKLDSNCAYAYAIRGYAYIHKNDYDRAITDLNQAIKLNPIDADSYNARGYVFSKKNDLTRAIADFEAALRISPDHKDARGNLEKARKVITQRFSEDRTYEGSYKKGKRDPMFIKMRFYTDGTFTYIYDDECRVKGEYQIDGNIIYTKFLSVNDDYSRRVFGSVIGKTASWNLDNNTITGGLLGDATKIMRIR